MNKVVSLRLPHSLVPLATAGVTAALVLGLTTPAHTDEKIPARAAVGLTELLHYSTPSSDPWDLFEVRWSQLDVQHELGSEYRYTDLDDPEGITDYISFGEIEGKVNTTTTGHGRAEAIAGIDGGYRIELPEYDVPVLEFASLYNRVACDFRGNIEWENSVSSAEGANDNAVLIFGTPVDLHFESNFTEVTVPLPDSEEEVQVHVQTANPEKLAPYNYVYNQIGVSRIDPETGDALLVANFSVGDVYVECDINDPDYGSEPGPTPEPTPEPTPDEGDGGENDGDSGNDGGKDGDPEPSPTPDKGDEPTPDKDEEQASNLPVTGGALAGLVAAGVLALGGGGAALYHTRRRKNASTED